ncbi:MAG: metal ABC transporter substrate-binding protein [Actinomycetota bacterium]
MRQIVRAAVAVLVTATALGACTSAQACSSGKLTVDSTVAPITDIVRQVVGNHASLVGLIPEGVDSHTFEPSPVTVRSLAKACVLFMDGLHLEGSTLKQAQANMPSPVSIPSSPAESLQRGAKGSEIIQMGDMTISPSQYAFDFTFPRSKGDPNPHLWMNPVYAKHWSEIIRDVMVRRDPANAGIYIANQARFAAVVTKLDSAIAKSIDSIPTAHKRLLTYHDSFAYFSRRYGIPVLGAIQPSDFSEPSPREVQSLIEQIKANHVPAIFGSEVFPSTVLAEVAREAHAHYVDKLRDDELPGNPGDPNHTYLGLMVDDVSIMTQALGGDPAPMKTVPTTETWQ